MYFSCHMDEVEKLIKHSAVLHGFAAAAVGNAPLFEKVVRPGN